MALAPNQEFGPYILIDQIAVGGMAEIYLAKTRGVAGFEKYLALKVIHPNFADDDQFVQMLIDEAKIAVGLNHVNIGQIFDLGQWDKTYYIAMEFIDGYDLFKVMRHLSECDVDVPIDVATYIVQELCTGLDYAHRKATPAGQPLNIIHRDISPQNVLLSKAGEVKIVDFGIAKAASRSRATQAGVIKGKYFYMSPEQAWGDQIDQRSDIFSAGIILYEVLTGQMLYLEEDLHRLLDMVRKAEIPRPSTRRADIPPKLETIVMKALARRPADRWQTAHDFRVALTEFLYSYASDFTPERLARLVLDNMGEKALEATTSAVPGAELLVRDELPIDQKSVIFDISELGGEELFDEEEDAGESTRISPPPRGMFLSPEAAFDGAVAEAEANAPDEPTLIDDEMPVAPMRDPAHSQRPAAEVVIKPPKIGKPRVTATSEDKTIQPRRIHPPRSLAPEASLGRPDIWGRPGAPRRRYRPTGPVLPAVKLRDEEPNEQPPTVVGGSQREWEAMSEAAAPVLGSAPPPSSAPWNDEDATQADQGRNRRAPGAQAPPPALPHAQPGAPQAPPPPGQPTGDQPGGWNVHPGWEQSGPFNTAGAAAPVDPTIPNSTPQPGPQPGPQTPPPGYPPAGQAPAPGAQPPAPPTAQQAWGAWPAQQSWPPAQGQPWPQQQQPQQSWPPSGGWPHATPAPQVGSGQTPWLAPPQGAVTGGEEVTLPRGRRRWLGWVMALGIVGLVGIGAAIGISVYSPFSRETPTIIVETVPEGAKVLVNGEPAKQKTPVAIKLKQLGSYRVRVALRNYEVFEQVARLSEQERRFKVFAVLTPKTGSVEVVSVPSGADVYINNELRGTTPHNLNNLNLDEDIVFEIRKRGYKSEKQSLKWEQRTFRKVKVYLKRAR